MPQWREFLTWLFRAEEMPTDRHASPPHSSSRAFLSWVFRPEVMPERPDLPRRDRGVSFPAWLFRAEPMPERERSPEPAEPGRGYLAWLFRPEPFPHSPDDETGPRR